MRDFTTSCSRSLICALLNALPRQVVEGTHDPTWDENLQLNINHSDAPIRLEIDDHTALSNTLIGNIQRTPLLIRTSSREMIAALSTHSLTLYVCMLV